MARRPRPKALAAYVFAGGFHVGMRRHFDVRVSLEAGYGVPTARRNFPDMKFYHPESAWPLDDLEAEGPYDLIYGNPPCAAWSGNNPNSHDPGAWKNDPRVACTHHHFKLLERFRPKVWVWESVTQAPDKGRELVEDLTARAQELGYSVTQVFHDARWLNTPQIRKRWFFVAHRITIPWRTPNWAPPTSAVEALAEVTPRGPRVSEGHDDLVQILGRMVPGERLYKFWEREVCPPDRQVRNARGQVSGRPSFGIVRLKTEGPASATVGYSMVHPVEHRFLTINEVQALAGFPDDFEFLGNVSAQLDLIARGVMPPVADWLGSSIVEAIRAGHQIDIPAIDTVDFREPPAPYLTEEEKTKTMPKNAKAAAPAAKVPDVEPGEGSGAYMRRLLSLGINDNNVILEAVHRQFPGSKAGPADVSYNRAKLRKEGAPAASATSTTAPNYAPVVTPVKPTKRGAARVEENPPFDGAAAIDLRARIQRLRDSRSTDALAGILLAVVNALENAK